VLRILAPILMGGTLGWLVLRLFFRPVNSWLRIVFYLGLGIPIGNGLFAICSFLTFLVIQPGVAAVLTAFCFPAALAICGSVLQQSGRTFRPGPVTAGGIGRQDVVTFVAILCLVTGLAALLLLLGHFLAFPHGMWDAHAMWNARARVIFRAPHFWRDVFLTEHSHPDYPLSLSILVFTGWTALGRETQTVPFALATLFLFTAATAVAVGVTIWKNVAWGLVAASVILCSIGYVSLAGAQYADVPLSAFFAACLVLLTLAYREENVSVPGLALAGGVAAGCGWIKNEGTPILFGLTLGLVVACALLRQTRQCLRHLGSFWFGAAPIYCILQYYRSFAPANDIVQGLSNGTLHQKLLDGHRWVTIAKRYGEAWWSASGTIVPLILILVFAAVVAGVEVEPKLRLPLIASSCAVTFVAATHFAVYLVTPNDLAWHLDTSVNRLVLQLLPSFVFLSLVSVRGHFLDDEPLRSNTETSGVAGIEIGVPEERSRDASVGSSVPAAGAPDFSEIDSERTETQSPVTGKRRRRKKS
jgi:hypothetical protein